MTEAAGKVATPIAGALSLWKLATGGFDLGQGIAAGDGATITDGVHDLVQGGAGITSIAGGPLAPYAKAFSAGFGLGDVIAPHVFGTEEEDNKAHYEEVPEDGVFKPTTGNRYVDGALDLFGIRD